jgi:hypothetical protein
MSLERAKHMGIALAELLRREDGAVQDEAERPPASFLRCLHQARPLAADLRQ